MNILAVNKAYNSHTHKAPAFSANKRATSVVVNGIKRSLMNTSSLYRNDLAWDDLACFLGEKYQNQNKVNVYCYGCSDGPEAYTLIMSVMSRLKDEAKKFYGIEAVDVDEEMIKRARSGKISVRKSELREIEKHTGQPFSTYIDVNNNTPYRYINGINGIAGSVKPILTDKVRFRTGDIFDDIKKIEPENSIVMFRNAWPYLKEEEQSELIIKLSQHMGRNSMLIIGEWDTLENPSIYYTLNKYGFRGTRVLNCYEKVS